ncbi:uncharacterized protein LOC110462926 [Mizuhopecten yessoensis]|uniref:Zinc finger protein 362 n=1 Tax=Mizuhopecten yessoensis TaxID=6573 RepID=A0A210PX64_MIZYE|nr:uncharacterized protein LOC110462926 [Mizuhopecten yessoensis]XP_021372847.1 uncharacterized protein LOC110462926 [Mizuhopecten yessoensis]OWF41081.1 Zinc finger protein 362 [Mizuhopecten yessoensis]
MMDDEIQFRDTFLRTIQQLYRARENGGPPGMDANGHLPVSPLGTPTPPDHHHHHHYPHHPLPSPIPRHGTTDLVSGMDNPLTDTPPQISDPGGGSNAKVTNKKIKIETMPKQNGSTGHPGSTGQLSPKDMSSLVHPDRRHLCPHCYKGFKSRQQLTQHNLVHTNVRKYHCKFCERSFKQLSHLHQHHRIHTGEKPYRCPLEGCDRAFPQLSNLQHHIRNHDKLVDSQFQCHLCDRAYPNEATLKAHNTRTHLHSKPLDLTQQQQLQQQQDHPGAPESPSPLPQSSPTSPTQQNLAGQGVKPRKRKASRPQHLYMPPTMVPISTPLTPEEENSAEQKEEIDRYQERFPRELPQDSSTPNCFGESQNGIHKSIPLSRLNLPGFDRTDMKMPNLSQSDKMPNFSQSDKMPNFSQSDKMPNFSQSDNKMSSNCQPEGKMLNHSQSAGKIIEASQSEGRNSPFGQSESKISNCHHQSEDRITSYNQWDARNIDEDNHDNHSIRYDRMHQQTARGIDMNVFALSKSLATGSAIVRPPIHMNMMMKSSHDHILPLSRNNFDMAAFSRQQKSDQLQRQLHSSSPYLMSRRDPAPKGVYSGGWPVPLKSSALGVGIDRSEETHSDRSASQSPNLQASHFSLDSFDEPMN